jgi:hypothetical protein
MYLSKCNEKSKIHELKQHYSLYFLFHMLKCFLEYIFFKNKFKRGHDLLLSTSPGMCVEVNHITLTRQLVSEPKFEPVASQIEVKHTTA